MNLIRRWAGLAAGLAAGLLLLPLPAMAALTFNGSGWTVKADTEQGGPTPPEETVADVTNNPKQQDDLYVSMGNYNGQTANAVSTIELTRGITLSSSNQTLEFEHQFTSQFAQAGANVQVHVRNANGSGDVIGPPVNYNFNTGSKTPVTVSVNQATTNNTIKAGTYLLDVTISYSTNNKLGSWKTISQHHFEFLGL